MKPLATYNVLTDPNLVHYFSNPTIRRHLVGAGLIRKNGSIIPDGVFRKRQEAKEHKKLSHETLATAIVKKTIDLERLRQAEMQRHLEELAKIELVERVRSARSRMKRNKSAPPVMASHRPKSRRIYRFRELRSAPPPLSRSPGSPTQRRRWDTSSFQLDYGLRPGSADNDGVQDSGEDDNQDVSRPRPIQFIKPLGDENHMSEVEDTKEENKKEESEQEEDEDDYESSVFSSGTAQERPFPVSRQQRPKSAHPRRREKPSDSSMPFSSIQQHYAERTRELLRSTLSPYLWPIFNNTSLYGARTTRKATLASSNKKWKMKSRARSALTTRDKGHSLTIRDLLDWNNDESLEKLLLRSQAKPSKRYKFRPNLRDREKRQCNVTLRYVGNPVIQKISPTDRNHEVVIFQQHCGGTCIQVYRGVVVVGEMFTFVSRRHYGYTFSVNIFVDGIRDLRLSSCCEYRHQQGAKLGGVRGHFVLVKVEGSSPCIRCQVDKQLGEERPRHPKPTRYQLNRTQSLKEVQEPVVHQRKVVCNSASIRAAQEDRSSTPDVIKRLPVPKLKNDDGMKSSQESILTEEDVCEDNQSENSEGNDDESIEDEGSFEEDDDDSDQSVTEDLDHANVNKHSHSLQNGPLHASGNVKEKNSPAGHRSEEHLGESSQNVHPAEEKVGLPKAYLSAEVRRASTNFSSDDDESINRQPIEHVVVADIHRTEENQLLSKKTKRSK